MCRVGRNLLPIASHVGPLQFAVSKSYLTRVAGIIIPLSGSGNRDRLGARVGDPTRGNCGHDEQKEDQLKTQTRESKGRVAEESRDQ